MAWALVTGGTKRIGYEVAHCLAKEGYNLILHDHTPSKRREEILEDFHHIPVQIYFSSADLTCTESTDNFLNEIFENAAVPDVFIHTASIFEYDEAENFTPELWHKHMMIHTMIPSFICQKLINHQKEGQKFSTIFFLDQRVWRPNPKFFSYTASKLLAKDLVGLLGMSYAPNMRVNGIAPGAVMKSYRQEASDFIHQIEMTPLQEVVSIEEVLNAILFILGSPSMTGQIITIDSGQSLDWRTKAFLETVE